MYPPSTSLSEGIRIWLIFTSHCMGFWKTNFSSQHITANCCYNTIIFSQFRSLDAPQLVHVGKIWDVFFSTNSSLCSASVIAAWYAICYVEPNYDDVKLYLVKPLFELQPKPTSTRLTLHLVLQNWQNTHCPLNIIFIFDRCSAVYLWWHLLNISMIQWIYQVLLTK